MNRSQGAQDTVHTTQRTDAEESKGEAEDCKNPMAFSQGVIVTGGYRSCPAMQCGATVTTALTPKHRTQNTDRHTGEQEPSGPGHRTRNTTHRACTPESRSQEAVHATPHTGRARR